MHKDYIRHIVSLALTEDIGTGDVTTNSLVPAGAKSKAEILFKTEGVVCGLDFAKEAFNRLDPAVRFQAKVKDGAMVKQGTVVAHVSGPSRAILTGERVALNFLSMLSGIATKTRAFADHVKPYKTDILDTRKTTPLLRMAERYAVKTGGGINHRYDLSSMAMIKDNHRAFCNGRLDFAGMVKAVKAKGRTAVELEVDSLKDLPAALTSGADIILLDNMTPAQVRAAVQLRNKLKFKTPLEASGGISLKNVRAYAMAGVERISLGGITHTRQAVDVSLELCDHQ